MANMLGFKQFISEQSVADTIKKTLYGPHKTAKGETVKPHQNYHWFDMDDTLVHHDPKKGAKIHVNDASGKRIQTLSTSEYNSHKLKEGHSYDYSEFADSGVFADSSHPINKMIKHAQNLLEKGHRVRIVTARSDMKNPHLLLDHLRNMGLDAGHENFHLIRAGNVGGKTTHGNKAVAINDDLNKLKDNGVDIRRVTGYDDHRANVTNIHGVPSDNQGNTLHNNHPNVSFNGVLVSQRPEAEKGNVQLETVYPGKTS
jgi:hypothetical protein